MKTIKIIFFSLLTIFVFVFVVQNKSLKVTFNFIFGSFKELNFLLFSLFVFGLGVVSSVLLSFASGGDDLKKQSQDKTTIKENKKKAEVLNIK